MRKRYVYFAFEASADPRSIERVKIGMSIAPQSRLKTLGNLELLFAVECDYDFAPKLERALHEELAHVRITNMRRCEGSTEWFTSESRKLVVLTRYVLARGLWPWNHKQRVIFS